MIKLDMLSFLCCPSCRTSDLHAEITQQRDDQILEGKLICSCCDQTYNIKCGVPYLIPEDQLSTEEWQQWRDHLDGLQERRLDRVENPDRIVHRIGHGETGSPDKPKNSPKRAFAQFIGKTEGNVLDIGCGAGKFRFHLNNENYYGLDPIVLPEVEDFPFVYGLAEYIPYKSDTFSHLFVNASLDHFRNVDRFFKEAMRVLEPGGKLHIAQQTHDIKGPITAIKHLAHEVKDKLEDRVTKVKNPDAPKHLSEFTTSSIKEQVLRYFEISDTSKFSRKWYVPDILFFSLIPKKDIELEKGI